MANFRSFRLTSLIFRRSVHWPHHEGMNTKIQVLLATALLSCLGIRAQPQSTTVQDQPKPQQAQPPTPGQITPAPDGLDDDPAFKRLSPEGQAWVRAMTNKLHTAIEQKDIQALNRLQLEVAQRELTGTKFCGDHVIGQDTFLVALALGDSRKEEAFVARWLEPEREGIHSAVFTRSRCIASDGDIVDGKRISKILPNSLAVSSQHGLVAYEALYFDHPAGGPETPQDVRRGVFIESRFLLEIDPHKASALSGPKDEDRDFSWNAQTERIDMRPGVALDLVAPSAKPDCSEAPKAKKPRFGLRLPPSVQKTIDQTLRKTADKSGVQIDPKAPNVAIKEAQKAKAQPCPAAPTTAPAATGGPPAKQ